MHPAYKMPFIYYNFLAIVATSSSSKSGKPFDARYTCRKIAEFINDLPIEVEWIKPLNDFIEHHDKAEENSSLDWGKCIRQELTDMGYYDKLLIRN
jgi:hypothetical protein